MRLILWTLIATPLAAQSPVRLDRPEVEFPEPFSNLIGLRELSNGLVIVSDALEQSVARLDFRTGDVTPVGRQGNGPGEFGTPGNLFALPGDTTLMLDLANARGMIILPGGQVSSNTVSFSGGSGGFVALMPRALDASGRYYGVAPIQFGGGGPPTVPDSMPVVRWVPGARMDTVFLLPSNASGNMTVRIGPGGGAALGGRRRQAFAPQTLWAVTRDGRIALVQPDPYRVEWMTGTGGRQAGPPVTYQPVRVTDRDKEAWADAQTRGQMVMRTPEGTRTMRTPRPNLDEVDFPEFKPPFEAVSAAPNGEIWVRVSRPATATRQLYDVFDAQGRRVRQVELGEGRRLVGFGAGTLYTVRVDEDDLQWLERYRLQAAP